VKRLIGIFFFLCFGTSVFAEISPLVDLAFAPTEALLDPSGHPKSLLDVEPKLLGTLRLNKGWGGNLVGEHEPSPYLTERLQIHFFLPSSARLTLSLLSNLHRWGNVRLVLDLRKNPPSRTRYMWLTADTYAMKPRNVYVVSRGWAVPLSELVTFAKTRGVEAAVELLGNQLQPSCNRVIAKPGALVQFLQLH
jgi:hypothetical protein